MKLKQHFFPSIHVLFTAHHLLSALGILSAYFLLFLTFWMLNTGNITFYFYMGKMDKHYSNTANSKHLVWDCPQPQVESWILNLLLKIKSEYLTYDLKISGTCVVIYKNVHIPLGSKMMYHRKGKKIGTLKIWLLSKNQFLPNSLQFSQLGNTQQHIG